VDDDDLKFSSLLIISMACKLSFSCPSSSIAVIFPPQHHHFYFSISVCIENSSFFSCLETTHSLSFFKLFYNIDEPFLSLAQEGILPPPPPGYISLRFYATICSDGGILLLLRDGLLLGLDGDRLPLRRFLLLCGISLSCCLSTLLRPIIVHVIV